MIIIDGIPFDTDYTQFDHSVDIERKYDIQTADGVKHGEVSGVFHTYALTLGGMDSDQYEALLAKLTEPVEYHVVTLPDGRDGFRTFEAMFSDIGDRLVVDNDYDRLWDELTVTFQMRRPA